MDYDLHVNTKGGAEGSQRRLWQAAVMILVLLLSVGLKLQNRGHGQLYFLTPDTEHVKQAAVWIENERAGIVEGTYQSERFSGAPQKYPMMSTLMYYHAVRWSGMNFRFPGQFPLYLEFVRTLHVALFGLGALLMVLLPLSWEFRRGCVLLACLSMVLHQYGSDVRLHAIAGVALFISVLCSCRISMSTKPIAWALMAALGAGLATGTLFTGGMALLPIALGLVLAARQGRISRAQAFLSAMLCGTVWLGAFGYLHPAVFHCIAGKGPLFNAAHFRDQSFQGLFGWGGVEGYLNDIFGVDPLVYIGYFMGLVALKKTGKWREPLWGALLVTVIPYQIGMMCFHDYTVRRASFIFPCLLPIAVMGWMDWRRRLPRCGTALLAALACFSIANIIKYNQLTASDTRDMAYGWVRAHLPRDATVLSDNLNPHFESSVKAVCDIPMVVHMTSQFYESVEKAADTIFPQDQFDRSKVDIHTTIHNPINLPKLMRLCQVHYYILNSHYRGYDSAFDTSAVVAESDSLVRFEPFPQAAAEDALAWPPDGNSYFIWKMWRLEHPGPIIEVYRIRGIPNR